MLSGGLGGGLFGQTQTPGTGGLGGILGGGGLGTGGTGTSGGLFGAKPGGGLFGSNPAGGGLGGGGLFGQTPTSSAGGGLFGQGAGGGGILGGTGQTGGGLFQTPQSNLGARPGGFGGGGLFGQTPGLGAGVSVTGAGGGLFNQSTPSQLQTSIGGLGGGGGLFGGGGIGGLGGGLGLAGVTSGTTVKFEPTKGTDTVIKNGLTQNVNTLLQCITAMKQFEGKSLEELRMEDYSAGRKGPSGPSGLGGIGGGGGGGAGLFGRQQATQQTVSGGLFGAKPLGGGLGGTTGTGMFNQQTPQTGLGATGGGGFFGGQTKLGGGGGMFGGQSAAPALGGGLFGGQTQSSGGLFGGGAGGGLFSQSNIGTGLGGTQLGAGGGLFNKPTGLVTGGLGTGGLGTNTGLGGGWGVLQTSTVGLGGGLGLLNNQTKPGGLGGGLGGGLMGGGLMGGGLGGLGGVGFGTGGLGGLGGQNKPTLGGTGLGGVGLGTGTLGLGGGLGGGQLGQFGQTQVQTQLQAMTAQQQEIQLKQQLELMAASPFGDSPLFRSAISDAAKKKPVSSGSSSPVVSKSSSKVTPHYKPSLRPAAKIHTFSHSPSHSHLKGKARLFHGLDDSRAAGGGGGVPKETFVPRKSIKTLIIQPKHSPPPLPDSTSPPHTDLTPHTPIAMETPPTSHTHSPPPRQSVLPSSSSPPAFSVSMTGRDESVESPQLRLGTAANPIEKPIPIRPTVSPGRGREGTPDLTTPTSSQTTPPRLPHTSDSTHTHSPETTPTSGLTRQPLRSRDISSTDGNDLGLVLTRSGYYTDPSLSELETQTVEGRCEVEDFTVGRRGCGKVCFLGVTDVVGLDLDCLVVIGVKEVSVYPDDSCKPEVGRGLNKPARVTLEQAWPFCKTTRQPITDPDRLDKMGYEEKLRRSTAKIGGTFIEYDRQTGTCVFEVEHFSKYKLQTDDSDEEEGGEGEGEGREGLPKRVKMAKDGHQTRQTSSKTGQSGFKTSQTRQLDEDEAMSDEEQFRDAEDGVAPMEPRPPAPPPSHSMTAAMGLNTHHIQVMKASFFGANKRGNPGGVVRGGYHWQPTQDHIGGHGNWLLSGRHRQSDTILTGMERTLGGIEFRDTPSPIPYLPSDTPSHHLRGNKAPPTRATPIPTPSQSLLDFAAEDSLHHSTVQNLSRSSLFHSTTAGRSARRPRPPAPPTSGFIKGQVIPRGDLNSLVPMSDSLVCGRTRLAADAGLFLGRSFRVGWGPNWTLSHSGSSISGTRHGNGTHSLQVVVEKVSPTPFMINAPPQKISPFFEPYLASQLEHSDVKFDSDSSIPRFHPREGACLLHGFDALSRHLPPSRDGDGLAQRQMQLLWGLGVALWGELVEGASENPALADQTSYVHCLVRRKAVTRWLMQAAASTVEKEVSAAGDTDSEYLGALRSLVSGRQIAGACRLAHKHRDHKLALLLGQITCGNPNFRRLAYEQLDLWRRLGVQEHISSPRLCLYALLAGLMVWDTDEDGEGGEGVNICRGLNWKRVFGLHLWYSCPPTARVAEAVAQFTRAFSDEGCYTLPPVPTYMEMKGAGFVTFGNYDDLTLDSCFHLLRLYCARDHSLEQSLDPATSVPFHLDYRISWHLWSVLRSLYYTHLHPSSLSLLHLSFSSQLESVGLWHWAVFVLLHLPFPAAREESVRAVMMRGCSASEEMTDEEEFLVESLQIPETWVYSAKAARAGYDGNHRQQALHLLQAEEWNHAHSVIIDHLAADDIISGDTSSLQNMLATLSDPSHSSNVPNWDHAGSGYLDFLRISSRLEKMAQESEEVDGYELEDLYAGLAQLAQRVRHLPARNPRETLCQVEIARRTAAYTKVVCELRMNLIGGDDMTDLPNPSREIGHTLLPLPLPSDAVLTEFRQLIQPHITELLV